MNLHEIQHDLIANHSSEAWYQLTIAGPSFHYRWQYGSKAGADFSTIMGEHHSHAVHRLEPSLTMSWGMEVNDYGRDPIYTWSSKFPDPSVRLFWVDFFWNNALIDRVELCIIDDRGVIPCPSPSMEVSEYELAVACLVHELDGGSSDDHPRRYLDTIGATRIRDEHRDGAGS